MENVDIHTTPALVPPPGITPNLQNPYSLERYIIATSVICLFLATSATLARTFTKAYILKKMQLEDYSLIFSTSGFAAFTAVIVAAGEDGAGRHQWNVSIAMTQRIGMYANVVEILYPPLMFAAKFAVLVQIQRIFTAHKKDFIYWSVLVLIAANIVMYATIFFVFIFACNPREKIWMPHLAGKCLSVNAAIIATGVMNLVSDCTILALPLMGISELQMPLKKKIGAGAVFATGVLACTSSICRLVYSVRLARSVDITWEFAPVGMWAEAEFATVILVGCFPAFPRLFKFLSGKDRDPKKYSYASDQKSNSGRNSAAPRVSINTPYHWQITTGTTSVGSYYPLEERTRKGGVADETRNEADPRRVHVVSQFLTV